ncbi:MAG: SHOCT domain-containing protein [Lachnospiraceae bacterium]
MNLFDKIKTSASQVVEATTSSVKAQHGEYKELKKALDGALARYEFTYVGGLDDIPKAKAGAWGMNVMEDRFAFRVTLSTKDWLYDLDIPYSEITDIRIEKRTISHAEFFLGAGNDANQQQENVVVLEYNDANGKKATLRVEMLTGTTIYMQAAKCKELMDLLRKNDILDKIQKKDAPSSSGGEDILGQIEKLSKLKEAGILTEEEFQAKKTELLSKL